MEYHVKKTGSNTNPGTAEQPFRTIGKAARIAQPGDTVTVHEGIYREWVNPRYGGNAAKRITYQAAKGESVTITGAEVITDWVKDGEIWKVEIDNRFFGDMNPYEEKLFGDWLFVRDRVYHLGEVYLDGRSMYEKSSIDEVRNPTPSETSDEPEFSLYGWYCEVDDEKTTIYANFHGEDPTKGNVEINVRPFCFWPAKPGCGYITVRGFTLCKAATQWAPPTALQEGLIGPHWSKGWIIEDNIISDSRCSGISLGKEESTGQNEWMNLQFKAGTQREREVIFRAVNGNWNKDNIGGHIVRNNTIFNCGQTGIVGHLGCVFSLIENNHIYNILHKREFHGAEVGGIKLHAAIDTVIRGNTIHNSYRGVWLDWQAQGTHVANNVFFDNSSEDLFVEVSHGPTMVDHNLMLSKCSFKNMAQGVALAHNLIAGSISLKTELNRYTPYHVPHSTSVAGVMLFMGGDDRYYNNIFLREKDDPTSDEPVLMSFFDNAPVMDGFPAMAAFMGYPVGSAVYNEYPGPDDEKPWEAMRRMMNAPRPAAPSAPGGPGGPGGMPRMNTEQAMLAVSMRGNVYFNKALPWQKEKNPNAYADSGIEVGIDRQNKKVVLSITKPEYFTKSDTELITTDVLGSGFQAEMPFEHPDGSPYCLDTDLRGAPRGDHPTPGPLQVQGAETVEFSFA